MTVAAGAEAQQPTRFEVGGQAVASGLTQNRQTFGLGASFDVNIASPLALEARATWFPTAGNSGHQLLSAGIRATLVRGSRVAFYGVAMPGVYRPVNPTQRDTRVYSSSSSAPVAEDQVYSYPRYFVLDLAAGFRFHPTPRLFTRVEVDRLIYVQPIDEVTEVLPQGTFTFVDPNPIGSAWDLNIAASYRFGRDLSDRPERPGGGRWTVGPQFGSTYATSAFRSGTVGAFASYRVSRFVDVDLSVSRFTSAAMESTLQEGGRMTQGLIGAKLGVRSGRFAVFFKMRAGANSYSRVYAPDLDKPFVRSTVPALDLGGVVDVALLPRAVLRVDIGETLSFVPAVTRTLAETPVAARRAAIYTLPTRVGVGWRF